MLDGRKLSSALNIFCQAPAHRWNSVFADMMQKKGNISHNAVHTASVSYYAIQCDIWCSQANRTLWGLTTQHTDEENAERVKLMTGQKANNKTALIFQSSLGKKQRRLHFSPKLKSFWPSLSLKFAFTPRVRAFWWSLCYQDPTHAVVCQHVREVKHQPILYSICNTTRLHWLPFHISGENISQKQCEYRLSLTLGGEHPGN